MHTNYMRSHMFSLIFVGALFTILFIQVDKKPATDSVSAEVKELGNLNSIQFDRSLDRILFAESYGLFFPEKKSSIEELIADIRQFRRNREANLYSPSPLDLSVWDISRMYLQFIIVYIAVLLLTYYAVQTFGLYRFIREKQGRESYIFLLYQSWAQKTPAKRIARYKNIVIYAIKAISKGMLYFMLFSPAYVIAYSFKTRFDTNSLIFMVGLGTISNALLITYVQKFYTFLVAESRKGYVETAVIKNLESSFSKISLKEIFSLRRVFSGHILDHIYENARYQYLSSVKEQASFLITGLIIIEMALNIQNHLCYTLLQTILYQQYQITLMILFGIFFLVKITEITVDRYRSSKMRRLENKAPYGAGEY